MKKNYALIFSLFISLNLFCQLQIEGDQITLDYAPSTQEKNILRFHYWRASVNGDATISYERYIAKYLSIEIGVGMTYRSYIDPLYLYIFDADFSDYGEYFDAKTKINYSFMAGVRFYLKEEFMEGVYLNPSYRNVNYKIENAGYLSREKSDYKVAYNDISLTVGYNHFLGKAFLDYFGGLGVRHAHINKKRTNQFNQSYETNENKIIPLLLIGMRVGLAF